MNIAQEIRKTIECLYHILDYLKEQEERADSIKIVDFQSYQQVKEVDEMIHRKGSLRTRKNGSLEYRYYENGKQYSIYAKTKKELYEKIKNAKPHEKKTEEKEDRGILFYDWIDRWISYFKEGKISSSSLYQIERRIVKHLRPVFTNKPLKEFTTEELQRFFNTKTPRTAKYLFTILNQVFGKAVDLRLIEYSPLKGVTLPRYVAKTSDYLTNEEVEYLMRVSAGHPMRKLFAFYLLTGCRRNEALSLELSDVDFKNDVIHIRGTKTLSSDRYVPLFPGIKEILKDAPKTGKIFDFIPEEVTRTFHAFMPKHHLHELRHTFATRCLEAGIEIKVIQTWLGHSSAQTTMNVYAKVSKELAAKSAAKLYLNLPLNIPIPPEN